MTSKGTAAPSAIVILASIVGAVAMLLRPTAFGEVLSFQISAALAVLITCLLLFAPRYAAPKEIAAIMPQAILFGFLIIYVAVRGLSAGGQIAENAFKGLLVGLVGLTAIIVCNSNIDTRKGFYNGAAIVIVSSCVCVLLTRALLSIGFSVSDLMVFRFEYTYVGRGDVLAPLTFSFNMVSSPLGVQPRLSGLFREPGLLPAFSCWAATYASYRRWPVWISVVTLVGSASSFSSLGLPLAMYTGVFLISRRLRVSLPISVLIGAALSLMAWPFVFGLSDIGLGSKIASDSISYRERMYLIELAFSARNILFGDGLGALYRANEGINLIAQTRIFGIVYLGVVITAYLIASQRSSFFIVGLIPAIVTILASQPMTLDVPTLIMFTSWVAIAGQMPSIDAYARRRYPRSRKLGLA